MGENLIVIGRISRPHGLKGEVRIDYFNLEDPHFFSRYTTIYLQEEEGKPKPYRPIKSRFHKKFILATLEGVRTRQQAEALRGYWVLVDEARLPLLGEDEYYWYEVLGTQVFTEKGKYVGEVNEILRTGSNDVYVVKKEKEELLIPAIKDVIVSIDKDARTMVIRPLPGLLEQNDF